jgi:hypothetical protein
MLMKSPVLKPAGLSTPQPVRLSATQPRRPGTQSVFKRRQKSSLIRKCGQGKLIGGLKDDNSTFATALIRINITSIIRLARGTSRFSPNPR